MSLIFLQTLIPKSRIYIWCILLLVVSCLLPGLTGCSEKQAAPLEAATTSLPIANPSVSATQGSILRWLKGIPCRPPCFEGITPGISDVTQAMEILKKNPFSVNPWIATSPQGGTLFWDSTQRAGLNIGNAYFDPSTTPQIIYEIHPKFTEELKLADLIQAYGEPDYVAARPILREKATGNLKAGTNYQMLFLYLSQGMMFESYFPNRSDFNKNLPLVRPTFFAPTGNVVPKAYQPIFENKVAWQGFKTFDFYCKDKSDCTDF